MMMNDDDDDDDDDLVVFHGQVISVRSIQLLNWELFWSGPGMNFRDESFW